MIILITKYVSKKYYYKQLFWNSYFINILFNFNAAPFEL